MALSLTAPSLSALHPPAKKTSAAALRCSQPFIRRSHVLAARLGNRHSLQQESMKRMQEMQTVVTKLFSPKAPERLFWGMKTWFGLVWCCGEPKASHWLGRCSNIRLNPLPTMHCYAGSSHNHAAWLAVPGAVLSVASLWQSPCFFLFSKTRPLF